MYNSFKGVAVYVDFAFTIIKNTIDSGLLPKFLSPTMDAASKKKIYKIFQIKMFGACFNEIFTEKTKFYIIYVSNFGNKRIVFPAFDIKNSI